MMSPGERIAAALEIVSLALNKRFDLQEKEQKVASQSLQERAMRVIEKSFPDSTEEDKDFQYHAMTVIEDDKMQECFWHWHLTDASIG